MITRKQFWSALAGLFVAPRVARNAVVTMLPNDAWMVQSRSLFDGTLTFEVIDVTTHSTTGPWRHMICTGVDLETNMAAVEEINPGRRQGIA